jgi:glycosyltransferase involved in cell wall biosynthesis
MDDIHFIPGKTKVYIHAACNVLYASYYIEGMKQFFESSNVFFNISRFPKFKEDVFAAIIKQENGIQKKIIIDFLDSSKIDADSLAWCDVYGKVNLEAITYDSQPLPQKIIPVGPNFAIRVWNLSQTLYYSLSNLIKSYKVLPDYKKFLSNYKQQFLRRPVSAYMPGSTEKNYIFLINSIWKKSPKTNNNRLQFIKACKSIPGLIFEGGFAPRQNRDIDDFDAYTTAEWYSVNEYLRKVKQSVVVYNTPAVLDCHGWKLGEFLAMGKAIISTPLSRLMPGDFIDRVHFYQVDDQNDYKTEIETLLKNEKLLQELEANARNYYEIYLSPQKVIAAIMKKLNTDMDA